MADTTATNATDTNSTTTAPTTAPRSFTCHDSLTRFFQRVRNLFVKVIPAYIDAHVSAVLVFVEGIRTLIENPVFDGILEGLTKAITPELLATIEAKLDLAIDALEIEVACKSCTTFEDKMKCIADQLATKSPELQAALLHALAVVLSRLTSEDVTTTQTELAALVAFAENELAHAKNVPA